MEPSPWRHLAVAWNGLKNGNRLQHLTIPQERPPTRASAAESRATKINARESWAPDLRPTSSTSACQLDERTTNVGGNSVGGPGSVAPDSMSNSTVPAVLAISTTGFTTVLNGGSVTAARAPLS